MVFNLNSIIFEKVIKIIIKIYYFLLKLKFKYYGYQDVSSTTEILICTECGKINKIKY